MRIIFQKIILLSVCKIVFTTGVFCQGVGVNHADGYGETGVQLYTQAGKVQTDNKILSPVTAAGKEPAAGHTSVRSAAQRNTALESCNSIENGGFEDGVTLEEFEAHFAGESNSVELGGVPGWYDLGGTFPIPYGSSDCFFRGSVVNNNHLGIPNNFFTSSSYPLPNQGVETPTSPGNNRYVGMVCGSNTNFNDPLYFGEGVYTRLLQPLIPGRMYVVNFKARAIMLLPPEDFPYCTENIGKVAMRTYFTNSTPAYYGSGSNTNINSVGIVNPNGSTDGWTTVSFTFTATDVAEYMVFTPVTIEMAASTTCSSKYMFLDEAFVSEYECNPCINLPRVKVN